MSPWASPLRNQRGVALPLALFVLVSLSVLVLAFLSMGGQEPQISRNLTDSSQARYAAEAGIEWAFDQLASAPGAGTGSWPDLLSKSAVSGSNPQAHWITSPANTQITLPGLTASFGTYTVQIRKDSLAADQALTGVAPEVGVTNTDGNGVVIVTAAGTHNGVTRQIQVVMRRVSLPPFPGAYSMPGVQTDLLFTNSSFSIDGQDYICDTNCQDPDVTNRTYKTNPSQAKMKYGLATQTGNQSNLSPTITYEARAEKAFDNPAKLKNIIGKDQTNPGGPAVTGVNTVVADASLNPAVMQSFLTALQSFSGTQILQSTIACPMVLTGSNGNPPSNQPTLTNGCGVNQTVNLGTRQSPALVYFRGELDSTSAFTGLRAENKIQGAGILVVEDGDLRTFGHFNWDGVVIVTGRYVSSIFDTGSQVTVHGATVANETISDEGGNQNAGTYFGTYYDGFFNGNVTLRNSQEALNIVQRALLFRMSTWREI